PLAEPVGCQKRAELVRAPPQGPEPRRPRNSDEIRAFLCLARLHTQLRDDEIGGRSHAGLLLAPQRTMGRTIADAPPPGNRAASPARPILGVRTRSIGRRFTRSSRPLHPSKSHFAAGGEYTGSVGSGLLPRPIGTHVARIRKL